MTMAKQVTEVVTIYGIYGPSQRNVYFTGSKYAVGDDIAAFPDTPEEGFQYIRTMDETGPTPVITYTRVVEEE